MSIKRTYNAATSISHFAQASIIASAAWAGLNAEPVYAGPANGQVVHGNVTFEQHGNQTIIRASDGSIINYLNFNIGANEIVRFIQPGEFARVLNRVTGNDPSVIAGQLLANGQVYIVNPAGVHFANGAVVDTAGLYAAAGHISNANFLAGYDYFTNLTGSVVNEGAITANEVHLLGRNVANHGSINAERGLITMVAGDVVYIQRHGGKISLKVDGEKLNGQSQPQHGSTTPDMTATPGVENTGAINARQGAVMLGAGDMYALAVRNSGTVSASQGEITVAAKDGLIHNTASGSISADADAGQAGSVVIQSPSILNSGSITADANSGQAGYVEVTSQNHTYLTDGSHISAAGKANHAHGGEILIHSYDGTTVMADGATVDVSGGAAGGDGGFVEVSGEHLTFNGHAELSARSGYAKGTLLLDPHNIIINNTGGHDGFLNDGIIDFGEGTTALDAYINVDTFANIVGDIILQATGSIYVGQNEGDTYQLVLNHNNNLILQAYKVITVRIPIIGANNVVMQADYDNNHYGWVSINVPLQFAGNAEFSGTDIYLQGHSLQTGGWQRYYSPTHLGTDYLLTGTDITFHSTLNSNVNALNRSLTIHGNAHFLDSTGGNHELRFLDVHGNTTLAGGYVQTSGRQRYLGATSIDADAHLFSSGGELIEFGGAVDGGHNLLVETAGLTHFNGPVGQNQALASVVTDAAGHTRISGDMHAGVIDFNDDVSLGDHVVLTGDTSVDFHKTLNGRGHDLTINSPLTTFHGEASQLGLLQTDAAGTTRIGANITGRGLDFNDDVRLIADAVLTGTEFIDFGKTVNGSHHLVTNSDRLVRFGGNVGNLQALASLTTNVGGPNDLNSNLVIIDGTLIRALGDIAFNPAGRNAPAQVATIAGRNLAGLHVHSLNGSILMGQHEKLTSLGDLHLQAVTGAITVGDLNTPGVMRVTSPDIRIWSRAGGSIVNYTGGFDSDESVDFIAGERIIFSSMPTVLGPGAQPIFATRSGGLFSSTLNGFTRRSFGGLDAGRFTFGGTVLDLTAVPTDTPPIERPPAELATALDDGPTRIKDFVPRDPFAVRPMERLAIYLRSLGADELTGALTGRALYNDAPENPAMQPEQATVVATRLRRDSVISVVDRYASMFLKETTDEESGETLPVDQSPFIREALASAWRSYLDRQADSGELDPASFYAFLQSDPEMQDALAYVDGLRGLFHELWVMGATRLELRRSLDSVLGPITPEQMQQSQLEQALQIDAILSNLS